ncbi:hypothetical protein EDB87DRAFT_1123688 [Lactarius vividus]|nr:hypothetical protein EDB87DRAFT_1123688 [Lactarius vividus]
MHKFVPGSHSSLIPGGGCWVYYEAHLLLTSTALHRLHLFPIDNPLHIIGVSSFPLATTPPLYPVPCFVVVTLMTNLPTHLYCPSLLPVILGSPLARYSRISTIRTLKLGASTAFVTLHYNRLIAQPSHIHTSSGAYMRSTPPHCSGTNATTRLPLCSCHKPFPLHASLAAEILINIMISLYSVGLAHFCLAPSFLAHYCGSSQTLGNTNIASGRIWLRCYND